ncbi:MAG: phosphoribosylformylglycinamidine cyclo-ligase [Saprospiraceae bacterium]|nr:phosphoribosylformylglycinamidine cyclo-ligase [Saprospiraceae bacterium]
MQEQYNYDLRGVSATKDEVHAAIKNLDKGLYPTAFCKILPDIVAGDPEYCNIMHADTAGTKTSLAYLYWKETGDISVWKGIVQDAMVMNLDDMACVGCVDNIIISSTIGRNKHLIPGEVISEIINGANEFINRLEPYGPKVILAGGETADVGDIVRTLDVGYTAFARMKRKDLIINDIQAGDVIVGLSSYGKAIYEDEYNGGMGSNGLTSARHDVLNFAYAESYPESFDPNTPLEVVYVGLQKLTDSITIDNLHTDVGKLLLSPTRTYMPILSSYLRGNRSKIHGMIHCTGGGQTKVKKFINNKRVIKDNLFTVPHLFEMIKEESNCNWKEMYQVFNMGHRLEIYLSESDAHDLIQLSETFGVEAKVIGRVEEAEGEHVEIRGSFGTLKY